MKRRTYPLFWRISLANTIMLLVAVGAGLPIWSRIGPTDLQLPIVLAIGLSLILGVALLGALDARQFMLNPLRLMTQAVNELAESRYEVYLRRSAWDVLGDLSDSITRAVKLTQRTVLEKSDLLEEMLQHQYELNNNLIQNALKLEARTEELVQSEKMAALGRLVAGMAHEINTPVGNAVTAASLMQERMDLLSQSVESNRLRKSDLTDFFLVAGETVRSLQTNLERAATLIRGFKDVAVDQSLDEVRRIHVVSYVGEVMLSLHPRLKKRPITWSIEAALDLECEVWPGSLAQVITNLVMNSLLHGFEETQSGELKLQVIGDGSGGTIWTYTDTGRGIASEHLDKVFEPFFTTKRNQGGTGLGLHIVFNVVRQKFKGDLKVESTVGKGVRFTWTIPRSVS